MTLLVVSARPDLMDRWLPKQVAGIVGSRGLDAGYSRARICTRAIHPPLLGVQATRVDIHTQGRCACLSSNGARWPMHLSQTLVVSTHAHGVDEGKIRVHSCAPRLPNLERGALRCPHLLPLVDLNWPLADLTHAPHSLAWSPQRHKGGSLIVYPWSPSECT